MRYCPLCTTLWATSDAKPDTRTLLVPVILNAGKDLRCYSRRYAEGSAHHPYVEHHTLSTFLRFFATLRMTRGSTVLTSHRAASLPVAPAPASTCIGWYTGWDECYCKISPPAHSWIEGLITRAFAGPPHEQRMVTHPLGVFTARKNAKWNWNPTCKGTWCTRCLDRR